MLLKICALIALVAFAQIVRAQEDGEMEEFKEKQDDDLEDRGNLYGSYRNRGKGWGNNNRGNSWGGSRGYRGGSRGANLRIQQGGRLEGAELDISNQVETNKIVPGIVEVAPTVRTESNSVQVVGSVKRRNLKQNSQSVVVQNNVVKATDIHVHTNTVVHKPKLVTKVIRRHNTKIQINTQPIKTNINIERQQDVIQPEVRNIVVYQNSEQVRRRRLPTIVRNRQQNQRLPTIREPTRNAGTDVIGNPLNAGSANLLTLGSGNFGGNSGSSSGFGGAYLSGGSRGYSGSNNNYRKGGRKGYNNKLHYRANEQIQEEEEKVAPEETKAEDEHTEESTN